VRDVARAPGGAAPGTPVTVTVKPGGAVASGTALSVERALNALGLVA
jgi:hypothetical protein